MENIATQEDQFFILLERVGTKGRYQRHIFILSFGLWIITAFLIFSVAFLLLPNKFICPQLPDEQQCKRYVCSLPETEWHKYEPAPILNSIITQLGHNHCQFQTDTSTYKMVLFVGIFVGYFIFMHFSDNLGRRFGMILTWSTATFGLILISLSRNMLMVSLGLLLAGAGCESNMRINLSILNQMVDNHLRQKYSLILQCSFGVSGILVSISYFFFRDWRTVNTLFCTIPAIIFLFIMVSYLQDTPNYLYKKGSKALLKSLQRIANINGFQCQVTQQDVLKVIELKKDHYLAKSKKNFSVLDLFRFKSLKKNTINLSLLFFFLCSLYIGPNSAINQFQVDIFLLQIILSLSDCFAYPIACYFVAETKRKTLGLKTFILSALFNFIAFFITSQQCDDCFSQIAKISLMFCARFCVCYYYGILFVYVIQIYPEQIRTIGFGTVSALGSLGAVLTQKIIQITDIYNQDPLLIFGIFSLVCLYISCQLPQTHGNALQTQIEQLKMPKQKKTYEPSIQQSYAHIEFEEEGNQSRDRTSSVSKI